MSSRKRATQVGGMEMAENLAYQEWAWWVQRWGQLLVVLFVIAGFLGFFGGGTFGEERLNDVSGRLEITHPRFARVLAPYDMEWTIAPELATGGQMTVWLDMSLLDTLQVEAISPQPHQEVIADGRINYHFAVHQLNEPVTILFHLQTQRPGRGSGSAGVSGGPELRLAHFVYP